MTVKGNRTVHVVGDFSETVDATETRTVTGAVTETFAASETRSISADQTETYGGGVTRTIGGDLTDTVSGSQTETITGGITTTTPANFDLTAVGGINMTTSGSMLVTATGGFTVLAPGGTKTVDQDFWKFGGGQGDAFSWQIGIAAAKLDLVELAVALTSTKMEAVGVSFSATGFYATKEGTKMETTGDAIQLGIAGLFTFGIMSIA
jgi:type VI secretion system secreted protein VgrG